MFPQYSWQMLAMTVVLNFATTFGGWNPPTLLPVEFPSADLVNYIAVPIKMTFEDASDYCMDNFGTDLATADTDIAVLEVRATSVAAGIDSETANRDKTLWIGITSDDDGYPVWLDGTPFTSDRFLSSFNNIYECGVLTDKDYLAYRFDCASSFYFVCNAPKEPSLAPSQIPSAAPTITHKRSECPVPNLQPCESFRCLGTDSLGNDENPNCIKKRPWGCKECADGFFRETLTHHACVECSTIEGCLDCKDWTGCSQCDEANGYTKRWNKKCGFFICKSS